MSTEDDDLDESKYPESEPKPQQTSSQHVQGEVNHR